MKVLIAEDDSISRRLLEAALTKKGYDVIAVCDGAEAWNILKKKNAPQLAVIDWMMPGMDGIEVCQKVRGKKNGAYTYIILLTAKAHRDDITMGFEAGADDYIRKPFNAKELHARVKVGVRILDLQKKLEDHVERLKELDQLKSDFLSTVSHELRTPIAVMRGGVSLCLDGIAGKLTDTQTDLLTDTLDNIDHLTRLINDLLDVSKIEAGKITLRRSSVDMCDVVRKIHKGFDRQAKEKGLHLITDLSTESIKVFVDGDKVTQIFNNLVSNAIRFSKPGGNITLRLEDKKDVVECSVSDTGIGIAEKNFPKLFSKFEQIGRVEGPGYKGTGLGLTIVKGLVEKHNGKIWVESELGKGTTFRFTLKKEPFPKIMVVDDSKNIVDVVKKFLSVDNYDFMEAYDGKSAVEKARDEHPSLIVLDMMLPEMDGYGVIENLKKEKTTNDIPILILSSYNVDPKKFVYVKDPTEIPILDKPVNQDALLHNVKEMLNS